MKNNKCNGFVINSQNDQIIIKEVKDKSFLFPADSDLILPQEFWAPNYRISKYRKNESFLFRYRNCRKQKTKMEIKIKMKMKMKQK